MCIMDLEIWGEVQMLCINEFQENYSSLWMQSRYIAAEKEPDYTRMW